MGVASKLERLEVALAALERRAGLRPDYVTIKQRPDGSWPEVPAGLPEDTLVVMIQSFKTPESRRRVAEWKLWVEQQRLAKQVEGEREAFERVRLHAGPIGIAPPVNGVAGRVVQQDCNTAAQQDVAMPEIPDESTRPATVRDTAVPPSPFDSLIAREHRRVEMQARATALRRPSPDDGINNEDDKPC